MIEVAEDERSGLPRRAGGIVDFYTVEDDPAWHCAFVAEVVHTVVPTRD